MPPSLEGRIREFRRFDLDGGHPVLDFANTVEWRGTARAVDWLREYTDLLAWSRRVGLISAVEAGELQRKAEQDPARADEALRAAKEVRERLHAVVAAIGGERQPRDEDLAALNLRLGRALACSVLRPADPPGRGLVLTIGEGGEPLERPLFRVLQQAAELLSSGDPRRLKVCNGEGCGWLFLDTTKNRSRRWCDMASCGNRAKVRRYYLRRSAARPEAQV